MIYVITIQYKTMPARTHTYKSLDRFIMILNMVGRTEYQFSVRTIDIEDTIV